MRQVRQLRPAIVALVLIASPCWSTEPEARNQASAADTMILADHDADANAASRSMLAKQVQRVMGVSQLTHVALIDAAVDADGCMKAPLAVRAPGEDRRSDAVEALAAMLRQRGIAVTLLTASAVRAIDQARQDQLRANKGSFSLSFAEGEERWFATRAELVACARVDPVWAAHRSLPHAALAAELAALHQDVVLTVSDSEAETRGPRWNIIEGELSSDGRSLDAGTSSARVEAILVLKDGSVAWSGEGLAQGQLRPPLDIQAVQKLKTYMESALGGSDGERAAGTNPKIDESAFDAVASGDLDQAPPGSTLGPSAAATLQAAAERVLEQLGPVLPGH